MDNTINKFDPWSGWDVPRVASNTPGELVIQPQDNGMYLAPCRVAGHWGADYAPIAGLLDTGSTRSAISARLAKSLGLTLGPAVDVKTAGGTVQGQCALLTMVVGTIQITDWPIIVLPMSRNLLIGNDLLVKLRARHLEDGTYYLQG
jgi:predicted aspartyl protease